jgi:ligand-binding sensor domain-containing protein
MKYLSSLLLSVLFMVSNANGQGRWTHYTNTTTPNCMIGDGQFLWIGTNGGLVKFDKMTRTYRVFHTSTSGIPMNAIMSLNKDQEGGIWVGTRGAGVARLLNNTWTTFNSKDHDFGNGVILSMSTDSNGAVWFGTDSGLVSYDHGVFSQLNTNSAPFESNFIYSLCTDRTGGLWVGTDDVSGERTDRSNLLRLKDGKWELHHKGLDTKYPTGPVVASYPAKNGDMWFGYQSKVARMIDREWQQFNALPSGGLYNYVFGLAEDSAGIMYMTTSYGASRFNGTTWDVMKDYPLASGIAIVVDGEDMWYCASQNDGIAVVRNNAWEAYHELSNTPLASNYVEAMTIDSKGVYWFANGGPRLTSFDGESWKQYNLLETNGNEYISTLAADSSGNIWMSTGMTGFAKWDGVALTRYNMSNTPMNSNRVKTIAYDKVRDRLWIGELPDSQSDSAVKGGLVWFDGKNWKVLHPQNSSMPAIQLNDIEIAPNGDLWISLPYFGVAKFDGEDTWTVYNKANSDIPSDLGSAVCIARNGEVWFASGEGAAKFKDGIWKSYTKANSEIGSNSLHGVAIDTADNVWFASFSTEDGGILKFDGETWQHYGLFDSPVGSMLILTVMADKKGNVIAGTYDAGVIFHHPAGQAAIHQEPLGKQLSVFPNPASRTVHVRSSDHSLMTVRLFDVLGREWLYSPAHGESELTFDVSTFPKGSYYLSIDQDGGTVSKPVMIY